jgi:hypothetical protein
MGIRLKAIDSPSMEAELTAIIIKIVDLISDEDMRTEINIREWRHKKDSLEKLATQAELKIRSYQIRKIRREVLSILKTSTNRIIISTIETPSN